MNSARCSSGKEHQLCHELTVVMLMVKVLLVIMVRVISGWLLGL